MQKGFPFVSEGLPSEIVVPQAAASRSICNISTPFHVDGIT
jgi:hypothetical protein